MSNFLTKITSMFNHNFYYSTSNANEAKYVYSRNENGNSKKYEVLDTNERVVINANVNGQKKTIVLFEEEAKKIKDLLKSEFPSNPFTLIDPFISGFASPEKNRTTLEKAERKLAHKQIKVQETDQKTADLIAALDKIFQTYPAA